MGREPCEMTCSVHLVYGRGADVSALADQAAERFAAGVDMVVLSLGSAYDASMVEPLARALVDRS